MLNWLQRLNILSILLNQKRKFVFNFIAIEVKIFCNLTVKIHQFKPIQIQKSYSLSVGNISKEFTVNNMKKQCYMDI